MLKEPRNTMTINKEGGGGGGGREVVVERGSKHTQ
jgi:hypothetical protein